MATISGQLPTVYSQAVLDAMIVNLKKYNPGFLSDDELIESFCVRTNEFASIVETLQENTGNSNRHVLVIGPRGSGKTSLLLRVAIETRRNDTLSSRLFPVVFAEESYEVGTCGEFWLECLDRLAAQVSNEMEKADIRRTWEELQSIRDDQALAERCLGALLDFSDREGKRLVLIVENMNMIFRDIADEDTAWRLRKTLQTESRIILLASATSRFEEIDNPEQALYDLFRVLTLRPLSTQECATLWEKVSGRAPAMGKIRSLEILTGGNPRLLAIIARFGAALSFRELMKDLFNLIDEHTEYFRSHIESLSAAQERRVYLALAKLWKPATTREIADIARLDTSQCSAQLGRLIERGVVSEKGGTPRRKRYYLTERLYNIYYLLRNGASDQIVKALIQFMVEYYSPDEWNKIWQQVAGESQELAVNNTDLIHDALINEAYKQFSELLNKYQNFYYNKEEQLIFNLMDKARRMSDIGDYDAVVDICNDIEDIYDDIVDREKLINIFYINEPVARALLNKSISLTYLNRETEAIIVCDQILERFNDNDAPEIIEIIRQVMIHKANVLGKLNRFEEEINVYDEYLNKISDIYAPEILSKTLRILINKAVALNYFDRKLEAIDIYNDIIEKFGNNEEIEILTILADAFANKGTILESLDRAEEVISLNDEVIDRFGNIDAPEIIQSVAQSFMNKGVALIRLNQTDAALKLYEEVIDKFDDSDITMVTGCVAQVLVQKSLILAQMDKTYESLDVCNEMLTRFGKDDSLVMSLSIAQALLHKANLLTIMDNFTEAVDVCNDLIDRFMDSNVPQIIHITGMAAANKGLILWQLIQPSANVNDPENLVRYLDDKDASKRDVQVILAFLSETGDAPAAAIRALLAFGVSLGYESVLALIQEASLEDLLLPLVTAFRREIGLETEVSQEVFDIAQDVRKGLAKVKR